MAQIWIQGKAVVVTDHAELLRLLPHADATAPPQSPQAHTARVFPKKAPAEPRAPQPEPRQIPGTERLRGLHAAVEQDAKTILEALASVHPKRMMGEALRSRFGGNLRRMTAAMTSISKRAGRGQAVDIDVERKGRGRVYRYRLTPKMMAVARDEGWASVPQPLLFEAATK